MRLPKEGALPAASLRRELEFILRSYDRKGVPEWTVERTREFRRVAHQSALISEACVHQSAFNGLDAPIHHVARRDTVGTRACIVDSDLGDALHRRRGIDRAVAVQQATVPMVGIFAEAYVACNVELGEEATQFLDGENDWAGGIIGRCSTTVLILLQ